MSDPEHATGAEKQCAASPGSGGGDLLDERATQEAESARPADPEPEQYEEKDLLTCPITGVRLTRHAKKRWAERFPALKLHEEWITAAQNRIGKKTISRIRKQCPNQWHVTNRNFKGYYYKVSANRVVFVMAPPSLIVTVFELIPTEAEIMPQWQHQLKAACTLVERHLHGRNLCEVRIDYDGIRVTPWDENPVYGSTLYEALMNVQPISQTKK
jgi:hypothetical protein